MLQSPKSKPNKRTPSSPLQTLGLSNCSSARPSFSPRDLSNWQLQNAQPHTNSSSLSLHAAAHLVFNPSSPCWAVALSTTIQLDGLHSNTTIRLSRHSHHGMRMNTKVGAFSRIELCVASHRLLPFSAVGGVTLVRFQGWGHGYFSVCLQGTRRERGYPGDTLCLMASGNGC